MTSYIIIRPYQDEDCIKIITGVPSGDIYFQEMIDRMYGEVNVEDIKRLYKQEGNVITNMDDEYYGETYEHLLVRYTFENVLTFDYNDHPLAKRAKRLADLKEQEKIDRLAWKIREEQEIEQREKLDLVNEIDYESDEDELYEEPKSEFDQQIDDLDYELNI